MTTQLKQLDVLVELSLMSVDEIAQLESGTDTEFIMVSSAFRSIIQRLNNEMVMLAWTNMEDHTRDSLINSINYLKKALELLNAMEGTGMADVTTIATIKEIVRRGLATFILFTAEFGLEVSQDIVANRDALGEESNQLLNSILENLEELGEEMEYERIDEKFGHVSYAADFNVSVHYEDGLEGTDEEFVEEADIEPSEFFPKTQTEEFKKLEAWGFENTGTEENRDILDLTKWEETK